MAKIFRNIALVVLCICIVFGAGYLVGSRSNGNSETIAELERTAKEYNIVRIRFAEYVSRNEQIHTAYREQIKSLRGTVRQLRGDIEGLLGTIKASEEIIRRLNGALGTALETVDRLTEIIFGGSD